MNHIPLLAILNWKAAVLRESFLIKRESRKFE